jgi:allantoin racemase
MKILVINPNTSESMTKHLERELAPVKGPDTEIVCVNPEHGPVSIESAYDEALAIPPTLELIRQAERDGYDAVVIACFSDPGLHAARELVSIPVVGIQEATMHVAAQLGFRFTITTTFPKRVPAKIEAVRIAGLESRLASVRPLNMTVLEMDREPECTKARLIEVAQAAANEDGAEVVILGCAGLAGYAADVERETGMKVLDPSPIALKTAEMLVSLGLRHSKRGLFAQPPAKLIK